KMEDGESKVEDGRSKMEDRGAKDQNGAHTTDYGLLTTDKCRDIDILFVGNLHPAVQRERLRWLGRLASLSDRYSVQIHTGVFGKEYRQLLWRARIAFNRSIRGEANRRVFEAAAAGALLFQEHGNLETPQFFQDRQGCVYYN